MASVRLQPPSSFDFKNPDEWPRWKRRFEQFRLASGLSEESGDRQVSTLMYCMGEDAEDTLTSTNISVGDRKKYDTVFKPYDDFSSSGECNLRKCSFQLTLSGRDRICRTIYNKSLQFG